MAVTEFIPLTDVKMSTEKQVKAKLSIEELTTIESPGSPSPANLLENPKKRAVKRASKKQTGEAKEVQFKKDSILIITEKPQAALKIASALGKPRKYSEDTVAYYEVQRGEKKNSCCFSSRALVQSHLFSGTKRLANFQP